MDNLFIFLDIFLVLCLFLSILIAVIRGFRKSLISFLSLLAAGLLLFIFINPITNMVEDIKLDLSIVDKVVELPDELVEEKQTISSVINYGIVKIFNSDSLSVDEDSQTASLIISIGTMFVKIYVYICGLCSVWILQIIFRVVFRIIFGKQEKNKRALCIPIGILHYILVFILVFLPILGTASLASQIITDVNTITSDMEENPVNLKKAMKYVKQYENTITKKVFMKTGTRLLCKNKDISIDAQYVGKALSFKTNDTTVRFLDEYILIRNVVPSVLNTIDTYQDMTESDSQIINLSKFDDSDIENISNIVRKSQFLRVAMPVVVEVSSTLLSDEYSKKLQSLEELDWNYELNSLADLIDVFKEYSYLKIDVTDFYTIITSKGVINFIEVASEKAFEIETLSEVLIPLWISSLEIQYNDSEFTEYDLDFSLIKSINWKKEGPMLSKSFIKILRSYLDLEFNDKDITLLFNNKLFPKFMETLFNEFSKSPVLTGKVLPLVMQVIFFNIQANNNTLDFEIDTEEFKNINWKEEIDALSSSFDVMMEFSKETNFDFKNWTLVIDNSQFAYYSYEIVDALMESKIMKEFILPIFANQIHLYIENNEFGIDMSFVNELITEESIVDLLDNDVDKLITILSDLKAINAFKGNVEIDFSDPIYQSKLINIIKTIFDLSIVRGNEEKVAKSLIKIINLEETLGSFGIPLEYENVTDWDEEIDVLCEIIDGVITVFGDVSNFDIDSLLEQYKSQKNKIAIAELVEDIGRSQLMKNSVYYIIESSINSISSDYSIKFTAENKYYIENITGWKVEILQLLNVIDMIKGVSMDENYKDLNPEEIKDIMICCSECEITTVLFGTVLNSIFDGIVEHDFTKKDVMRKDADVVYNTIKLANMVQEPSFDLNDKNSAKDLVDTIFNLAQNEQSIDLTNQLLSNIVDENKDFNYTNDDIEEAAYVINDIIKVYQNSTNQDEFDLDNLPYKEQEKLDNSELGKLILELFFDK